MLTYFQNFFKNTLLFNKTNPNLILDLVKFSVTRSWVNVYRRSLLCQVLCNFKDHDCVIHRNFSVCCWFGSVWFLFVQDLRQETRVYIYIYSWWEQKPTIKHLVFWEWSVWLNGNMSVGRETYLHQVLAGRPLGWRGIPGGCRSWFWKLGMSLHIQTHDATVGSLYLPTWQDKQDQLNFVRCWSGADICFTEGRTCDWFHRETTFFYWFILNRQWPWRVKVSAYLKRGLREESTFTSYKLTNCLRFSARAPVLQMALLKISWPLPWLQEVVPGRHLSWNELARMCDIWNEPSQVHLFTEFTHDGRVFQRSAHDARWGFKATFTLRFFLNSQLTFDM